MIVAGNDLDRLYSFVEDRLIRSDCEALSFFDGALLQNLKREPFLQLHSRGTEDSSD